MTWYGVFHRDLNLNNVLYIRKRSGRIILKICDFGISHFKNMKGNNLSTFRKGTPVLFFINFRILCRQKIWKMTLMM
jgi:serine/threonine protein kinase